MLAYLLNIININDNSIDEMFQLDAQEELKEEKFLGEHQMKRYILDQGLDALNNLIITTFIFLILFILLFNDVPFKYLIICFIVIYFICEFSMGITIKETIHSVEKISGIITLLYICLIAKHLYEKKPLIKIMDVSVGESKQLIKYVSFCCMGISTLKELLPKYFNHPFKGCASAK
jgi:energy-coupling factor transporter transmembrane protein EcfT